MAPFAYAGLMPADELVLDQGVLDERPICEFQAMRAVRHAGGVAVLPWRADWLEARARDLRAVAAADELLDARFSQCLVHLQKSRAATWLDLAQAWARLEPGGRLLLCGGNDLGVTSAVKRLARELEQTPRILANRRRARIVAFERDTGPGPLSPESGQVQIEGPLDEAITLRTDPGVFSARRLDLGSELLLDELSQCKTPRRILDLGCGVGPLGLTALLRWSDARARLLDADARAVACATHNADTLGLGDRCEVTWWDASEPLPA
ncbi:MAG: methyltransferase, partial [Myxococcota bacterium]